jgi:hypothetical protein
MTLTSPSEVEEAVSLGYLAPRILIFFEPGPLNASAFRTHPTTLTRLLAFKMFFKALFNPFKLPQNSATTFYSRLHYSERISETSEDVPTSFVHNEKTSPLTPLHAWLWIAQGTLFLCSVTLLVIAYKRPLHDAECVKQLFTYCPLLPLSRARV